VEWGDEESGGQGQGMNMLFEELAVNNPWSFLGGKGSGAYRMY